MFPTSAGGRVVAVVLMHVTLLFILPLLIGHICARCVQNQNEFTHQEQEDLKAELKRLGELLSRKSDDA